MKKLLSTIYKLLFYNIFFPVFKMLPTNPNKIIYISHYGNRFGCNPKHMYEFIKENYPEYENVIVMNKGEDIAESSGQKALFVRYRSLAFLKELATAKYWVVNTNLPPELVPKKDTVYFQTWHAAGAFKKFGLDLPNHREKEKEEWKRDTSHWTCLLTSAESVSDIYAKACGVDKNIIHPVGLPRNDIFFNLQYKFECREQFRQKHNIPENKKIILYAPTYRDVEEKNPQPLDLEKLENALGNDYVFILKLHPLVANKMKKVTDSQFVLDCSDYEDIQDLLLVSDLLVTDYSSVIFDFAITGKPMIFYAYDLEEYDQNMRGFYFPYKEWVPGPIVYTQDELVAKIKYYDHLYETWHTRVLDFALEYNASMNGNATREAVKLLFEQ